MCWTRIWHSNCKISSGCFVITIWKKLILHHKMQYNTLQKSCYWNKSSHFLSIASFPIPAWNIPSAKQRVKKEFLGTLRSTSFIPIWISSLTTTFTTPTITNNNKNLFMLLYYQDNSFNPLWLKDIMNDFPIISTHQREYKTLHAAA